MFCLTRAVNVFFSQIHISDFFGVTALHIPKSLEYRTKTKKQNSFYVLKHEYVLKLDYKSVAVYLEASEPFYLNFCCTLIFEFCLIQYNSFSWISVQLFNIASVSVFALGYFSVKCVKSFAFYLVNTLTVTMIHPFCLEYRYNDQM